MVRTLIHASSWQRQLLEFQRRCESATPEEEADLIREGFSLFALVPPSWGLALCRNGKRERRWANGRNTQGRDTRRRGTQARRKLERKA